MRKLNKINIFFILNNLWLIIANIAKPTKRVEKKNLHLGGGLIIDLD